MPTQIRLTWFGPRNCWKKFCNGKVYYLAQGRCSGKSDLQGYRIALEEWQQKRIQVVGFKEFNSISDGNVVQSLALYTDWRTVGQKALVPPIPSTTKPTGIRQLQSLYLAFHDGRADGEQIAIVTAGEYRDNTEDFVRFLTEFLNLSDVFEVNGLHLQHYRQSLLRLTQEANEHKISVHTANKRLRHVKTFLNWLYENEYLEVVPRGLISACKGFTRKQPDVLPFTVDEVKCLLNAAGSRRTKLYILLAINLGYTQIDIATLQHEDVDWKTGIVSRSRHKSGIQQEHRLWPITARLLREEMTSPHIGLMLLDRRNNALLRIERRADRKLKRNDSIKLAFDRAMVVAGFDNPLDKSKLREKRRFKSLKKTSASEIARLLPQYPHLPSQFLAHGERATKKHYVKTNYDLLFSALDELEKLYGVVCSDEIAVPAPTAA